MAGTPSGITIHDCLLLTHRWAANWISELRSSVPHRNDAKPGLVAFSAKIRVLQLAHPHSVEIAPPGC